MWMRSTLSGCSARALCVRRVTKGDPRTRLCTCQLSLINELKESASVSRSSIGKHGVELARDANEWSDGHSSFSSRRAQPAHATSTVLSGGSAGKLAASPMLSIAPIAEVA